jgi:hypothetical protein
MFLKTNANAASRSLLVMSQPCALIGRFSVDRNNQSKASAERSLPDRRAIAILRLGDISFNIQLCVPMAKPLIVVFGATGTIKSLRKANSPGLQGGSVVRFLAKSGKFALRGITRNPNCSSVLKYRFTNS